MIGSSSSEKSGTRPTVFSRWGSGTGLAVVLLCGIILAFYHGLWLPGLTLIKRDAFRYFLPLKQYVADRLSAGELPHWFSYEALGCPFLGISGIGIFHPFTVLYFPLSVPDAYRASTLLSCLLAALGAFVLGRMLTLSRMGALLAGVVFALSGYVVSLTENVLYLYSLCMLPLFCAALEKSLAAQRAWVVAPATIWATVFLHGDVQTGYYYGFIALLWMGMRAPGSYGEASLRLALTGGLTLLLAGIQLGPAWAIFLDSDRSQPSLFLGQALHWSTHPLRLWTVLAAPVFEKTTMTEVGNFFLGTKPVAPGVVGGLWAESLYLGVPVIGLALLGAWHRRDLRMLALLAGAMLLLSLGRFGGLYQVFYHVVPLWSAFRYPEKFMGIVSFATAMLAGAGLDQLRAQRGRPIYWLAAAVLCLGIGLGLRTEAASAWAAANFEAPHVLAHEATSSAGRAFLYSAVTAFGVWLVVTGSRMGSLRPEILLACLVALVTFDLAWANLRAYHTAPVEAATFTPPFAQALATRESTLRAGRFRLFSIPEDKMIAPDRLTTWLGVDGASSIERRQALDMEHNASFHLESLNVYIASRSSAFRDILKLQLGVAGAARYNVAYYIGRRGRVKDPQFASTLIAELPEFGLALFKSSVPVKPRAYLSLRPERAAVPVNPAMLIARPEFRNGEVDVIETSDATLPGPARNGEALIERYAPEEVQVRVVTQQPAVLILLDAFDKGWTATLETGAPLSIMRANGLVRAVTVPGGDHVVTFRYDTPLMRVGAAASLAGTVICLWLIAQARRHTHRVRSAP